MDQFTAELRKIPPITRLLTASSLAITIPVLMKILPAYNVLYITELVFKKLQVWRLYSSFFLGPGGINYIFELVMLYRAANHLESGPYVGRSGDFAWQLLFAGASIIGLTRPLNNAYIFARPLLVALTYLSSSLSPPGAQASLFGLITFPVQFFPYVMIGLDLLTGGPGAAAQAVAGAVAGHAWLWSVWGTTFEATGPLAEYARAPRWLSEWLDGAVRRPPQTGATGPRARMAAGGVEVVPPRRAQLAGSTTSHQWGSGHRLGTE